MGIQIDWWTFRRKAPRKIKGLPTGTVVFKGFQGAGKTLSMVHYARDLHREFPNAAVFSNVTILEEYVTQFATVDELENILSLDCGENGKIVLIDEAHLMMNKKRGISLDFLAAISQQRKNRTRLIMSSQIWEELDISLRKQVKEVVTCRVIFGKVVINSRADGESLSYDKLKGEYVAKSIGTRIFKMTQEECALYDTFQKISRNDDYFRPTTSAAPQISVQVEAAGAAPRGRRR